MKLLVGVTISQRSGVWDDVFAEIHLTDALWETLHVVQRRFLDASLLVTPVRVCLRDASPAFWVLNTDTLDIDTGRNNDLKALASGYIDWVLLEDADDVPDAVPLEVLNLELDCYADGSVAWHGMAAHIGDAVETAVLPRAALAQVYRPQDVLV